MFFKYQLSSNETYLYFEFSNLLTQRSMVDRLEYRPSAKAVYWRAVYSIYPRDALIVKKINKSRLVQRLDFN